MLHLYTMGLGGWVTRNYEGGGNEDTGVHSLGCWCKGGGDLVIDGEYTWREEPASEGQGVEHGR